MEAFWRFASNIATTLKLIIFFACVYFLYKKILSPLAEFATAGRLIASQALGILRKVGYFILSPILSMVRAVQHGQNNPSQMPVPTGPTEFPEFPEVDRVVAEFLYDQRRNNNSARPKPYVVRNISAFVERMRPGSDIVCPFVGMTSTGKTSLLKAIFNLNPNDNLLRVCATMGTTIDNTVMLWRVRGSGEQMVRLWLMDMPSVAGPEIGQSRSESNAYLKQQLYMLRKVVQAACYVTTSNPTDDAKNMFQEVCKVLNNRVFMVNNPHHSVYELQEWDRLRMEAKREYSPFFSGTELKIVQTKIVRANGATEQNMSEEKGIDELRNELERWLVAHQQAIANDVRNARRTRYDIAGAALEGLVALTSSVTCAVVHGLHRLRPSTRTQGYRTIS